MYEISLGNGNRHWLRLIHDRVNGQGHVMPRLVFALKAQSLVAQTWVIIDRLDARLSDGKELLGVGNLSEPTPFGGPAGFDTNLALEIPLAHGAVEFLAHQVRGEQVGLSVEFTGLLYVRSVDDEGGRPVFPGKGEWTGVPINRTGTTCLNVQIARSDWFSQVLQPLGTGRYIMTEIHIIDGYWQKTFRIAVGHMQSAERAYATGDDPATFSYQCAF